jgi:hemoglobin
VTTTPDDSAPPNPPTPYERFGGAPFFESLVSAFYARIARDPVLRPMYPEEDLEPAERRLRMFLEQYWGGPDDYQQERGHPRLRLRHAPYPVDALARDRWLANMHDAVAEQNMAPEDERELWQYLVSAAFAMQNIDALSPPATTNPPVTITEVPQ